MNSPAARAVMAAAAAGREDAQPVASPCISVCRMDAASGLCEGCLRTLDEIAQWSVMDDEGKRGVWRRIGQRVAQKAGT